MNPQNQTKTNKLAIANEFYFQTIQIILQILSDSNLKFTIYSALEPHNSVEIRDLDYLNNCRGCLGGSYGGVVKVSVTETNSR